MFLHLVWLQLSVGVAAVQPWPLGRFPCWLLIYKYWRNSLGSATLKFAKMFLRCLKWRTGQSKDLEVSLTMMVSGFSLMVLGGFHSQSSLKLCLVGGGELRVSGEQPGYYLLVRYWSLTPPTHRYSPRDLFFSLSLFIDVIPPTPG